MDESVTAQLAALNAEWQANATEANQVIVAEHKARERINQLVTRQEEIRREVLRLVCPSPAEEMLEAKGR